MTRPLRHLLAAAVLAILLPAGASQAAESSACRWPAWDSFRQNFMSEGGRIVDPDTPAKHSTSEGQSYALFFALVANDRDNFARILRWTEENLAGGDLTARLPAWQWGKKDDDSWGVLDANAASDSDLWIAYVLGEAGRLWREPRYSALAELLAERILREETALHAGLGRVLLPGPKGFRPSADSSRLNPSYLPLQLFRRMAALYPKSDWRGMTSPAFEVTVRSAPLGFAPDWVLVKGNAFAADPNSQGKGSYNAIRVYLWAGLLPADEPLRGRLLAALAPMAQALAERGVPPESVDSRSGATHGVGNAGFSAALIPFLEASGKAEAARQQTLRVTARAPLQRRDNYYEQALTVFAQGWQEGRYRFRRDGALDAKWSCAND
jgi:endoglucanase